MPLTIHSKTMKSPLVQMDWSTNTQLKIGKKKNNNNNNNEGRGTCHNLITVQCFSTRRYYSTCLFLGNTIYSYLLKTVILPRGSIPRVSHMQILRHPRLRFLYMVCWRVKKKKKTSLYNFHYGHSLITKIKMIIVTIKAVKLVKLISINTY